MKKELSPAMIAVGLAVAIAAIGGLWYALLGPGSRAGLSNIASPQAGVPKSAADFQRPVPTGSGVNSITGEPLSATATQAVQNPGMARPAAAPPGPKSAPQ